MKGVNMRKLIVLAFALLLSTPSFESFAHKPVPPPAPAPTPVSTPAVIASPWWMFPLMALPIIGFVIYHCQQTKCMDKK